jgi:hypothetical protein
LKVNVAFRNLDEMVSVVEVAAKKIKHSLMAQAISDKSTVGAIQN